MTITITGNNNYLLRKRFNELTTKFVAEHGELALQKLNAEETEPTSILEAIQSLPFLASRKMVVLQRLGLNRAATEQIEQIISSADDSMDLIFFEPNPDKRTNYFKVLKHQTNLEEYTELDVQALASWLVAETKEQGGQLSSDDAKYMVDRLGPNQELLANELKKLIIYDPRITRQTIDLLTVKTPQSKIFDLLDAAFSGDKKRALELYDEQRAQRVEPQAIMAMLAWQLDLISLAVIAKGRAGSDVARTAGISPYPFQKAQRMSSNIDKQTLKTIVDEALAIDIKSKTTNLDLNEALKTYITLL
jgi:DNA polymerase-3 subunit delta